jgi:beta-1,4-mannosyltransferase
VDRDGHGRMDVAGFRACLAERKKFSTIAWTVHNLAPHAGGEAESVLTATTAELADVEFHLGRASVEMVAKKYPRAVPPERCVISHGGYWHLIGERSPEDARRELGISPEEKVLLVFGQLRHEQEYLMALQAARTGWRVLIVGRMPRIARARRPVMWLRRQLLGKRVNVIQSYLKDEEVDRYVKACDAMLIARQECLNSGNVFLGMTFGKPVIGPAVGNVGEVLRETGNGVFKPAAYEDFDCVLGEARRSDLQERGKRNDQWLRENGQWRGIGQRVVEVLRAQLRKPQSTPSQLGS